VASSYARRLVTIESLCPFEVSPDQLGAGDTDYRLLQRLQWQV